MRFGRFRSMTLEERANMIAWKVYGGILMGVGILYSFGIIARIFQGSIALESNALVMTSVPAVIFITMGMFSYLGYKFGRVVLCWSLRLLPLWVLLWWYLGVHSLGIAFFTLLPVLLITLFYLFGFRARGC